MPNKSRLSKSIGSMPISVRKNYAIGQLLRNRHTIEAISKKLSVPVSYVKEYANTKHKGSTYKEVSKARITFAMEKSLYEAIAVEAEKQNVTKSKVICDILEDYFTNPERKPSAKPIDLVDAIVEAQRLTKRDSFIQRIFKISSRSRNKRPVLVGKRAR